jgi:hypothetical protein
VRDALTLCGSVETPSPRRKATCVGEPDSTQRPIRTTYQPRDGCREPPGTGTADRSGGWAPPRRGRGGGLRIATARIPSRSLAGEKVATPGPNGHGPMLDGAIPSGRLPPHRRDIERAFCSASRIAPTPRTAALCRSEDLSSASEHRFGRSDKLSTDVSGIRRMVEVVQSPGIILLGSLDIVTRDPGDTPRLDTTREVPPFLFPAKNAPSSAGLITACVQGRSCSPYELRWTLSRPSRNSWRWQAQPPPPRSRSNRALSRLRIANTLRPNRLTTAAIEALDLAHMRLTPVGQGDDQVMIRQRRFISTGMRDVQLR